MTVQSAQSVTVQFTTRVFATGVGTNADSLPTGTLYVNGTANGATVTVTNISTGLYKAAVTMPTLAIADRVQIIIAATVSSVSDTAVIWGDSKDILVDGSGDVTFNNSSIATVTTVTNQLTAAAIATGVWQDATGSDFTTTSSIGKSLYTSGVAPGAANGLFIAGTNAATTITTGLTTTFTGNLTGSVGSVSGLTASNLDATISSRMATYTQPTGFLAATFPSGTVANTTNITAGTITTATNLTTNNDKTGYTLTSAYDAAKTAAQDGDAMTLTAAYNAAKTASQFNATSDKVLVDGTVALSESYAAQGAGMTLAQLLYGINQFLGQHSTAGTVWSVQKRDGATTAKTYNLDSATAPTSIAEAT